MKAEGINSTGKSPQEKNSSFDLYQKDFGVTLENLSGKFVLDVGCGTDVEFLRYCLEHGINITGMDVELPDEINDALIKGHFVQGNISHLPFGDKKFDLILNRALPNNISLVEIENMLPLLRSGGEIKITPFFPETNPEHKKLIDGIMAVQDKLNFKALLEVVEIQKSNGNFPRYSLTIQTPSS